MGHQHARPSVDTSKLLPLDDFSQAQRRFADLGRAPAVGPSFSDGSVRTINESSQY